MSCSSRLPWAAAFAMLVAGSVLADYDSPPGWNGDPNFTHQTWEFNTGDEPLMPDSIDYPMVNSYGDPWMTEVYLAGDIMFWSWDSFAGDRLGVWGGMAWDIPVNDPAVGLTFVVPTGDSPGTGQTELWTQVNYWGSISANGLVLTVELASDASFSDIYEVYEAIPSDIEDDSGSGSGTSGQWWRFTHTFTVDDQPIEVWVRYSLIPAGSTVLLFDAVSVDTRRVGDNDCPEDLDGDGYIGQSDLGILLASYELDDGGDINGDGFTNQSDLGLLLAVYDQPCP